MFLAPQNQALEVIKSKLMAVKERHEGYRQNLTAALYEILALERDRPHDIAKKISRRVAAVSEILQERKGTSE